MKLRHSLRGSPYFSICIPQYNRTSFLVEACRSLAEQTFQNFELCISDDRSTDGREDELLAFLERSPLAFVYQKREKNGRYDANLRSSVSLATGKYCFLLGNDDCLASPTVLEELAADMERLGPAGVVMTNFEDFATGVSAERVRRTWNAGAGPAVAAATFRNFSFVSGIVLDRERALAHATSRWDGSEMYQMYIGCRIIAEGGRLLNIQRVTVRKDIQLPDERVDSYALKPRIARCPVMERRLPMNQIGRLVIDAIAPYQTPGRVREKVIMQLLLFTYPFWIVEYRRIQSWRYALGICLGMRPRNLLENVPISWTGKLRLTILYGAVSLAGLLVPVKAFQAVQANLYSLAKSCGSGLSPSRGKAL
jgi:glycosyltransferase involved in cell wall biosynthesis